MTAGARSSPRGQSAPGRASSLGGLREAAFLPQARSAGLAPLRSWRGACGDVGGLRPHLSARHQPPGPAQPLRLRPTFGAGCEETRAGAGAGGLVAGVHASSQRRLAPGAARRQG